MCMQAYSLLMVLVVCFFINHYVHLVSETNFLIPSSNIEISSFSYPSSYRLSIRPMLAICSRKRFGGKPLVRGSAIINLVLIC